MVKGRQSADRESFVFMLNRRLNSVGAAVVVEHQAAAEDIWVVPRSPTVYAASRGAAS
jgi:hypothetical protein